MSKNHYICCHECDEVVKISKSDKKGIYKCPNCHHTLLKHRPDMVEKVYILSLTSLILFIISISFPFLSFNVFGNKTEINLFTSLYYLYLNKNFILSIAILFTTILIPLLRILINIFIFAPIYHKNRAPFYAVTLLKLQHSIEPWGMLDVFLIGILVTTIKLTKMGTIVPGVAVWSFGALVILMTYIQTIYDSHIVWEMIDSLKKDKMGVQSERN